MSLTSRVVAVKGVRPARASATAGASAPIAPRTDRGHSRRLRRRPRPPARRPRPRADSRPPRADRRLGVHGHDDGRRHRPRRRPPGDEVVIIGRRATRAGSRSTCARWRPRSARFRGRSSAASARGSNGNTDVGRMTPKARQVTQSQESMKQRRRLVFVCQECGAQSPKWLGRCADCGAWNSLVEERVARTRPRRRPQAASLRAVSAPPAPRKLYADIETVERARGSRPASTSSIACSAAASCPARSCCSAASPASASPRCCCRRRRTSRATVGPVLYAPARNPSTRSRSRGERLGVGARRSICSRRPASSASSKRSPGSSRRSSIVDSVQTVFSLQVPVGARQHRPGARGGDAVAVRREGPEHSDRSRRPRHEGRQPRRAEGARARRRHGAVLRRRAASLASRRARGEEPLRRGQRARRVRDDRHRAAAGAESVEAVPVGARVGHARLGGAVLRRRLAADPRRGAGARQHQHATATRAAWRAASIRSGCRCCSRCSRSAPASTWSATMCS